MKYNVLMSGTAWTQLRDLADTTGASMSQAIEQIAGFPLTREGTTPILLHARWRAQRIFLTPETIHQCREQAKSLLIVSSHQSQEYVGLVVEAYLKKYVSGPKLTVQPKPIQPSSRKKNETRDLTLSTVSWRGLKELFGQYPSRNINDLALRKTSFMLSNVEVLPLRRNVHHTHISTATLNYFAEWAERLGIDPPARMGRISWASIFLEYLGRGGISIVQHDTEHDLRKPRRRARSHRDLVGTGV